MGLYLGRSPLHVSDGALQNGLNFRIKEGKIGNINLGWASHSAIDFGGAITLHTTFVIRGVSQQVIVGTARDLFVYDQENDTTLFLNRRYAVGTVDVSGAANAVVTVDTGTPNWVTNEIKPGDFISFGDAAERDPAATWYEIDTVDAEDQLTLIGGPGGAGLSGQDYTIRRTFTGGALDFWVTETFVNPDDGTGDDLWFATNGLDDIITWDGSATQVTAHPELGFTARTIKVYKNMMIYGYILEAGGTLLPSSVINSDVGKPLNAGSTGTGLSEQFRIHDGTTGINRLEDLGDNLVIYSERNTTLCQFIGDPLVFVFREVSSDIGPIGGRGVADFGDYHEFLAADSQYLFDGVALTEIGKQLWRTIIRQRDATRQRMTYTHFDEEFGELYWIVPLTSDPGSGSADAPPAVAFVEHYLEEVGERVPTPFSKRSFPFTAAGYSATLGVLTWDELTQAWEDLTFQWNDPQLFSAFPITVVGTADGRLMTLNSAQSGDGTLLPSFIHTGRKALGDGRIRGLLKRIYPFSSMLQFPLTVTTHYADHGEGPNTISDEQTFDQSLPEGGHFVTPYRRGRFYEIEFGSEGTPWELSGWDHDAVHGGRR